MPFDSLRRRLSTRLRSHHIDEDYSNTRRSNSSSNSVVFNEAFVPAEDSEVVPSYEVSQLMYEQNLPIRPSSPHTPDPHSHSSSTNRSRQSSVDLGASTAANATHLKSLGLKFLNARQHFALACCRDMSLIPCILGLIQAWRRAFYDLDIINSTSITSAKLPEHFLTGVWCIVAGYLSYSVLDGLMIRWIVTYSTSAAILRMLTMSTMIVTIEQYIVSTFSADGYKYGLHIWILISCCLTVVYIVQNFVTSNLDLRGNHRARFFDFYNIAVFAVVPVGLASFITMIGLLRSLLIVRIDIENFLSR